VGNKTWENANKDWIIGVVREAIIEEVTRPGFGVMMAGLEI